MTTSPDVMAREFLQRCHRPGCGPCDNPEMTPRAVARLIREERRRVLRLADELATTIQGRKLIAQLRRAVMELNL